MTTARVLTGIRMLDAGRYNHRISVHETDGGVSFGTLNAFLVPHDDRKLGAELLFMVAASALDFGHDVLWLSTRATPDEQVRARVDAVGFKIPETASGRVGTLRVSQVSNLSVVDGSAFRNDRHASSTEVLIVDAGSDLRGKGRFGDPGSAARAALHRLREAAARPGRVAWTHFETGKRWKGSKAPITPPGPHRVAGSISKSRACDVVIGALRRSDGVIGMRVRDNVLWDDPAIPPGWPARACTMIDQCSRCRRIVGAGGLVRGGVVWCDSDCHVASAIERVVGEDG